MGTLLDLMASEEPGTFLIYAYKNEAGSAASGVFRKCSTGMWAHGTHPGEDVAWYPHSIAEAAERLDATWSLS